MTDVIEGQKAFVCDGGTLALIDGRPDGDRAIECKKWMKICNLQLCAVYPHCNQVERSSFPLVKGEYPYFSNGQFEFVYIPGRSMGSGCLCPNFLPSQDGFDFFSSDVE
jgi:hypothetical protein